MSDFTSNNAALKIQFALKLNKCIKNLEKFKNLNLDTLSQSMSFNDFRKIIIKKELLEVANNLCTSLESFKNGLKINSKVLITIYLIKNYTDELIGKELDRHPIDNEILFISANVIDILKTNKINDLWNLLREFKIIFKDWSTIDKDRTIEKLIVSYYYRSEHIRDIKSDKIINTNQSSMMIKKLTNMQNDIIQSIKLIDKNFDLVYLQENYVKIFNDIQTARNQFKISITNTMKKAYYDMLSNDVSNGNLLSCFTLIKEIGQRLNILCPSNKAELFNLKFADDNLTNILSVCEYTEELINFIWFIIDFIIIMDAPINDASNKQWKLDIEKIIKVDFSKSFPQILIQIEEHIDIIYQMIINLNQSN